MADARRNRDDSSDAQSRGDRGKDSRHGLLHRIFATVRSDGQGRRFDLDQFLQEPSTAAALRQWLGDWIAEQRTVTRRQLLARLNCDIAQLDELINRQVNAVLHHPQFQRLESAWRGLRYLVAHNEDEIAIKIRALDLTWQELAHDMERALEFDQSQLFRRVYGDEFDMPGGQPFGVLLGDYEIRHRISREHRIDDLTVLASVAQVAAAAFAPFVASAHPSLFGLDSYQEMERPLNFPRTFAQTEYLKWNALRQGDDARFVGLMLPRVLIRLPYKPGHIRSAGFRFRELVDGPNANRYLWGSPVYAFGAVLMRAFARSGWLAEIRGVRPGHTEGGLITDLPVHSFSTDAPGIATKSSTDVMISDDRERELGELGFIPLCHCKDSDAVAFYSVHSIQQPRRYDRVAATTNARISAMLPYTLCVSRFAHYLKVIGRENLGRFTDDGECEDYLHRWLQRYVTSDDSADAEVKARFPLREASVQVRQRPDKPGSFGCVIHLKPHFHLDQLLGTVKLVTELASPRDV